jgi:hypothetical protein
LSLCLLLRPKLMQHVRLRWSMASPFPLEVEIHYHDVFPICSLPTCNIRHSVASHNMQYSLFHFRWYVWSMFFSFFLSDHIWASYKRTGKTQDPKCLSLSLVSGICRPVKTRLLNFLQTIALLFCISFPELSRNEIFRPFFLLMLLTNFIMLMNDALYYKSIYRPNRCSAHTLPWMTCLKGLEGK